MDRTTGRDFDADPTQPQQTVDLCNGNHIQGRQTMNRRQASRLILTGSLAGPALIRPDASWASNRDEEENEGLSDFGQISLRLTAGIILLHSFYLLTATQWWGIDLRGDHRQFNENRASVGGFFGRLTRPTIATRLQDAVILGQLFMLSNSLFFFTDNPRLNLTQKMLIAHRFVSWEPRARLRKVSGSNLSPNRIRQQAVNVGVVALISAFLVLLVNPVINRNIRVG
ncbi:MAG: hypothetical protein ACR2O1_12010 [Boseongicola sp.]